MNWYVLIILISPTMPMPAPLSYEMWAEPYTLEADCRTAGAAKVAEKTAAAASTPPVPPLPVGAKYTFGCIQA